MSRSGIIFFSNNNLYQIEMLKNCLYTLRYYDSKIPITIFHDGIADKCLKEISKYNVSIRSLKRDNPYINKYYSLLETPYSKTLYLDNDVLCLQSFKDIFDSDSLLIMQKNDFYEDSAISPILGNNPKTMLKEPFPWYNTGILVYDKSFIDILNKYEFFIKFIPVLRHFDQSLISYLIYLEKIPNCSSWRQKELQLVLCDTYIEPQYPKLKEILKNQKIPADMNYTSNSNLFFSQDFLSFAKDFLFIHYNLGNPDTPHLKIEFFEQIVKKNWFSKTIGLK